MSIGNNLICAPLAQLVEHLTLNQGVQGSSPWRCMKVLFLMQMDIGDAITLHYIYTISYIMIKASKGLIKKHDHNIPRSLAVSAGICEKADFNGRLW